MSFDFEKMKIFELIEAKNWKKVRQMLRDDPENVRRVFLDRKTALHHALRNGVDMETLKLFIELGADINAEDPYGDTPIFDALKAEAPLEIIEYLVTHGARLDQKGYSDFTVVLLATMNSDEKVLECLLKNGANPNVGCHNSWTPLHNGAKNSNQKILETLFRYGAKLPEDSPSQKPTEVAAANSNPEVLKVLTEKGANIGPDKASKRTLLHSASRSNPDISMIRFLVEDLKNDVNCRDMFGDTPLIDAANSNPNINVLKYLLKNGADPSLADSSGKRAIDVADTEEKKAVLREAMLTLGIDPDREKTVPKPNPGVYKGRSRGLKLIKIELGNNVEDKAKVPFPKRARFFDDCDSKLICSWQQELRKETNVKNHTLVYPLPSEEELNALIDYLDGKTESSYFMTLHKTDIEYMVICGGFKDRFICWFMENASRDIIFNLVVKNVSDKGKYSVETPYGDEFDAKHILDRENIRNVALHYAKTGKLSDDYDWEKT